MKTALFLGLAAVVFAPVHAQVFRPDAVNRRPVVSFGVSHPNHGYHGGYRYGHSSRGYIGRPYYGVSFSTGYGYYPAYVYYDGYGAGYPYYGSYGYGGSAAGTGLLLGALAGGIIGHNSGEFHHNGWRGAAWGAGVGWLLGTIADVNRRTVTYPQPGIVQPAPVVQAQPAAQPSVTIVNHDYNSSTPMSAANSLFGR